MHISAKKSGRDNDEKIDVTNLKCAPEIIESMAGIECGVYRAYHMNKMHWLTVDLGECAPGTVSWLLKISFELTSRKKGGNT
jgi:predicted DNA-binding protein (MmcQ/YjbR family)